MQNSMYIYPDRKSPPNAGGKVPDTGPVSSIVSVLNELPRQASFHSCLLEALGKTNIHDGAVRQDFTADARTLEN